MPINPDSVLRVRDSSGDAIKVFLDGDGRAVQAVALVDQDGNHLTVLDVTGTALESIDTTTQAILIAVQAISSQVTELGYSFKTNNVTPLVDSILYVGKSRDDGMWLVQKVDTTSGVVISWATQLNNPGIATYSAAWSGRAGLSYTNWDEAA